MTNQPEALREAELLTQLRGMGYGQVTITDDATLLANLQAQLEAFNGTTFTQRDMTRILNHLQKGTLYDRGDLAKACARCCSYPCYTGHGGVSPV